MAKTRSDISAAKALAKLVIRLPLRTVVPISRVLLVCARGKDAEISLVHEREDQADDATGAGKQNPDGTR
jgi:hypothetical protein